MPLQKPHPQGPPKNQLPSKCQQLKERRRTLHTISELSVMEIATPEFNSFIAAIQRQPQDQIRYSKAITNVEKAGKRRSLPQHIPSPQHLRAEAALTTPRATTKLQTPAHHSLHYNGTRDDEKSWNLRREQVRFQRERAAAATTTTTQGYRLQPLQQLSQTGSYPTIPRKAVHSSSRLSLQSYSSHHHLPANGNSMSGLSSSSSSSNGTLNRRSSLTTISGQSGAWLHDFEAERGITGIDPPFHATRSIAVRRSRSRSGSSSHTSFTAATPPPIPVASPPPMQRYYAMPSQHPGNGERPIRAGLTRSSSTARTPPLPTTRIDHVELSKQNRKQSTSREAQQQYQTDVQKARLESLAALTAGHPGSYAHPRTSPPNLANTRPQYLSHTSSHPRPPPQCTPLPRSTMNRTTRLSSSSTAVEHCAVPKRESLAQWKAEREGPRPSFDDVRRADMKEGVGLANELKSEKEEEMMKLEKKCSEVVLEKERGCFGGVLRLFGVGL